VSKDRERLEQSRKIVSVEQTNEASSGGPLIVGHRGASSVAPENTLAAFARAHADGADGIEFDVRLAADGVPVCIHDATLRRTARRPGAVSRLTSAELSEIDVGSWFTPRRRPAPPPEHEEARAREFQGRHGRAPRDVRADADSSHELARSFSDERIPTLARVLELFGARFRVLYVELKCGRGQGDGLARAVAEVLRAHACARTRCVVESFDLAALARVRAHAPELRTAALFERKLHRPLFTSAELIARVRDCGAAELALQRTLATRRTVEAARAAGLPVTVWTVDQASWAVRARALGLRAVITNRPAALRLALEAARTRRAAGRV
jgi:glycerophosphoryl diester phosphodiesterase